MAVDAAGKVTFGVKNDGATVHGFAITPRDRVRHLKAGSYELVSFLPGHYAAGQRLPLTVK